jgi:hypothetical protein
MVTSGRSHLVFHALDAAAAIGRSSYGRVRRSAMQELAKKEKIACWAKPAAFYTEDLLERGGRRRVLVDGG